MENEDEIEKAFGKMIYKNKWKEAQTYIANCAVGWLPYL